MKNEIPPRPCIYRLSISTHIGEKKENVPSVKVVVGKGIEGDAHFGSDRPVSLLPYESFSKMDAGQIQIDPGDFAENITTRDLDFSKLVVGSRIALGDTVVLEVIQIGKECHNDCVIKQAVGDCIMPLEGVFARPLAGGQLREGDPIKIIHSLKE
ncbi:MAG: MOSC domain-containing protein [Candidatus Zixiibacteriota bacterium]|nr:MAG: MOSC domain-containing protein [candidate division Zixibacteria bacterium]